MKDSLRRGIQFQMKEVIGNVHIQEKLASIFSPNVFLWKKVSCLRRSEGKRCGECEGGRSNR